MTNRGRIIRPLVYPSGLDRVGKMRYNAGNFIGQFVTILSVNKTRNRMGAKRSFFIGMGAAVPIFLFWSNVYEKKIPLLS